MVQTTQVEVQSSGQATAVYDYAGADSGDLSVQSGQVVNVIEKTSDDCKSFQPSKRHVRDSGADFKGGHVKMEVEGGGWFLPAI